MNPLSSSFVPMYDTRMLAPTNLASENFSGIKELSLYAGKVKPDTDYT